MVSIGLFTMFNVVVLLIPPAFISNVLELMPLPATARTTLLLVVVINVVTSATYERWGAQAVARIVSGLNHFHRKARSREGKAYKAIETNMR